MLRGTFILSATLALAFGALIQDLDPCSTLDSLPIGNVTIEHVSDCYKSVEFLPEKLNEIAKTHYTCDFDFHADFFSLAISFNVLHINYQVDCNSSYVFKQSLNLFFVFFKMQAVPSMMTVRCLASMVNMHSIISRPGQTSS
ncbi:MAG: hypothetical protein BYD32DRAFT_491458 [Podila humilis]|nr:MAG: hypothetical protein BYD32DRAFT_491458 [Podila humilis]